MFKNRWENVDDGVWQTKDNHKHNNGAIVIEIDSKQFVMLTFRLVKDDVVSLQTARNLPKSLKDAQQLAEEFIEKLEKFNG